MRHELQWSLEGSRNIGQATEMIDPHHVIQLKAEPDSLHPQENPVFLW